MNTINNERISALKLSINERKSIIGGGTIVMLVLAIITAALLVSSYCACNYYNHHYFAADGTKLPGGGGYSCFAIVGTFFGSLGGIVFLLLFGHTLENCYRLFLEKRELAELVAMQEKPLPCADLVPKCNHDPNCLPLKLGVP